MTARGMDFETALRRRRRLREEVVCSEPWVETIVQLGDETDSWLYLPDAFPPGGAATAMRLCSVCERIAPPSIRPGPCCDCQVEQEELAFGKWLLRRERRDLLAELGRLWWRSAIPCADQPIAIVRRRKKSRAPSNRYGGASLGGDDAPLTEAEEGCPYDTREFDGGAEGAPGSMAGELSIALEIARRRLDPPKKEDARAPGRQLVLLPESKTRLLAEIAYCRKNNGKVMPSAKRYTRHSPYLRAPEDWIAHSLARSLRDDFGVDRIEPVKVALTAEQIERFGLHTDAEAKKGSAHYRKFIERYGKDVYELEALSPAQLQDLVRQSIQSVLDMDAFEREQDQERQDAASLGSVRHVVRSALLDRLGDQT